MDDNDLLEEEFCAHENVEEAPTSLSLVCTNCGRIVGPYDVHFVQDYEYSENVSKEWHSKEESYIISALSKGKIKSEVPNSFIKRARSFEYTIRNRTLQSMELNKDVTNTAWNHMINIIIPSIFEKRVQSFQKNIEKQNYKNQEKVAINPLSYDISKFWVWGKPAEVYYFASLLYVIRIKNIPFSILDIASLANISPNRFSKAFVFVSRLISDSDKNKYLKLKFQEDFFVLNLDKYLFISMNAILRFLVKESKLQSSSTFLKTRVHILLQNHYGNDFVELLNYMDAFNSNVSLIKCSESKLFKDLRMQTRIILFTAKSSLLDQGRSRIVLLLSSILLAFEAICKKFFVKFKTTIGNENQNNEEETLLISTFLKDICTFTGASLGQLNSYHTDLINTLISYFCVIRPSQKFFNVDGNYDCIYNITSDKAKKSKAKKKKTRVNNKSKVDSYFEKQNGMITLLPIVLNEIKLNIDTPSSIIKNESIGTCHYFWNNTKLHSEMKIKVKPSTSSSIDLTPSLDPPSYIKSDLKRIRNERRIMYAKNRILLLQDGVLESIGDMYIRPFYAKNNESNDNLCDSNILFFDIGISKEDIVFFKTVILDVKLKQYRDFEVNLNIEYNDPFFTISNPTENSNIVLEAYLKRPFTDDTPIGIKINRDDLDHKIEQAILDGESYDNILNTHN